MRRVLKTELVVVLLLTFGYAGLRAVLDLIDLSLAPGGLGAQHVVLNAPQHHVVSLDIVWSVLYSAHLLAFAGLALILLAKDGVRPAQIGLDWPMSPSPTGWLRRDILRGMGLAALIGLPGLALYVVARSRGLAAQVTTATGYSLWRVPELILFAVANAAAEEVVVVGYLMTRLRELGWGARKTLAASALLRGSYHLYQGYAGGLGNIVMGLVFGWAWRRSERLWPLILAHALIDTFAFVGYVLLEHHVSWLS